MVTELSATSDGGGVISIRIGRNAYVKTNAFRYKDNLRTIVEPGHAVHAQALGLRVGQPIAFSGTFFRDDTDCVREISVTTKGSMREPEFIMRFTDLSPVPQAQATWLSTVQEPAEQAKSSKALAEQGDADAQNKLCLMYNNGEGVSRDHAEAMKWCRKAANLGHAGGQFNLGRMYAEGVGVTKSLIRAYMWFSLSAQAREAAALAEKARIAELISIAQQERAEEMAKRCLETNYAHCDEQRNETPKKEKTNKPAKSRGCGSRGGPGYRKSNGQCASW